MYMLVLPMLNGNHDIVLKVPRYRIVNMSNH